MCIKALDLIEDDTQLFIFTVRSINIIFEVFDFTIEDKLLFVKENLEAFKTEFNSNKSLSKQLYKKYNGLNKEIIQFMEIQNHIEYQPLIDLLNTKNEQLKIVKKTMQKKELLQSMNPNNVLSSYIHMTLNRISRDKQRIYELVCYDSLSRF